MKRQPLDALIGAVCDGLYEDDGIPPSESKRHRQRKTHTRSKQRQRHRKRAQLIQQVEQALVLFLADQEDEALLSLSLRSVEPAPDSTHLRATLHPQPPGDGEVIDLIELQRRLDLLGAAARITIAASIHRKKAPLISFVVVPA